MRPIFYVLDGAYRGSRERLAPTLEPATGDNLRVVVERNAREHPYCHPAQNVTVESHTKVP